jgi:hypothetical protein
MNDDLDDEKWEKEMRDNVVHYLDSGNVAQYGEIGSEPAYSIPNIISIWAIESKSKPGFVGFWCFAGDIPTDVIQRNWNDDKDNPRKALFRLLEQWKLWLPHLSQGDNPPDINLRSSAEMRKHMSSLLSLRIDFLQEVQGNDEYWEY